MYIHRIYNEKLRQLKLQLESILNGTHAEFIQGKVLIQQEVDSRLFANDVSLALQVHTQRHIHLKNFRREIVKLILAAKDRPGLQ